MKDPAKAKLIYPEMTRDAILFGGTDPGRFCPTYMIFCESFIPHRCQPAQDQKFDRRDVYIITQNALGGRHVSGIHPRRNITSQHDRSAVLQPAVRYLRRGGFDGPGMRHGRHDTGNGNSDKPSKAWPTCCTSAGPAVPRLGAHVEKRRRAEGVYPPKEIYMPTPEDSQACFQEYAAAE